MSTSWHLIEHQAKTRFAGRPGQLDLGRPENGFSWQGPDQHSLQLLRFPDGEACPGLNFRASPYIRNEDLIVNYGGDELLPFHLQVYWCRRSHPIHADCNAMEWTLAMQTECLDRQSQLNTSTTGIGAEEILQLPANDATAVEPIASDTKFCAAESTGCLLVRLGKMSYIELIHPQDFLSVEVAYLKEESQFAINRCLFDCNLEKGVIVRARLQGLCVPRENDEKLLRDAYREFLQRDLPLTT
ncbi:MAG: hypothetical protein N2B57_02040 [Planctomycetales bacterium]